MVQPKGNYIEKKISHISYSDLFSVGYLHLVRQQHPWDITSLEPKKPPKSFFLFYLYLLHFYDGVEILFSDFTLSIYVISSFRHESNYNSSISNYKLWSNLNAVILMSIDNEKFRYNEQRILRSVTFTNKWSTYFSFS